MTVEPASDELIAELEAVPGGIPNWTMAALIARIRQAEAEREAKEQERATLWRTWREALAQRDTEKALADTFQRERDEALARVKRMDDALERISCLSQTENLLWWQKEARAARKEPTDG